MWFASRKEFIYRTIEQSLPVEPIVPVAEALDAILAREFRLLFPNFRDAKIIEA